MDQKIWFTSDLHLGHGKILEYDNRPFTDIEEHDTVLIDNWNSVVGQGDIVYYLGDFALTTAEHTKYLRSRLNGSIRLVAGNHDDANRHLSGCWEWVRDLYDLKMPDPDAPQGVRKLILCHYPLASWRGSGRGNWMIHGHCHHHLPDDPNLLRMDIGANGWNYMPLSYAQIKAYMTEREQQIISRNGNISVI